MSGYWYVGPAPDGRRFCWAKTPAYRCPVADDASELRTSEPAEADGALTRAAAAVLGVEARWLSARLASASTHGRVRDEQERLTERCRCGARMERLGFATWVEREAPERSDSGAQLTRALGGSPTEQVEPRRYLDTKREARAWAHEQLQVARTVASG